MSLADGQLHKLIESLLEKLDTGHGWEYIQDDQFEFSLKTGKVTLTRMVEKKEGISLTSFKIVLRDKKGDKMGSLVETDESGENYLHTLFQLVEQRKNKDLIAFNAVMEELEEGE